MTAARRRGTFAAARRSAGHTQESLAAALHVDRSTVIRWEAGEHVPLPYLWPKLAYVLGRSPEQLEQLIGGTAGGQSADLDIRAVMLEAMGDLGGVDAASAIYNPGYLEACDWLDKQAGWQSGTTYRTLTTKVRTPDEVSKIRLRDSRRGTVARSKTVAALDDYYIGTTPLYRAVYGDTDVRLAITASAEWLDVKFALSRDTDLLSLASGAQQEMMQLDATAADGAMRRLLEAAVLDVAIVNSPLYRLVDLNVEKDRVSGSVSIVPFVQYALTTDLLETELVDHLAGSVPAKVAMPMRDRYLPTISSVFDVSGRYCSGGMLALCAVARPADRERGPADYLLLTQERGRRVLNGVGRISVVPRGFHQPLTDFRADAPIGSTVRRELEEELFHRVDVDNTISDSRLADPMHPNRLSEPMRWLMQDPGRMRFECTGLGFNLVNGNFEYACLIVIEDPEFWVRYGDRIEANWESVGLRQYSSRDPRGIRDLVRDEAWSNEGLFALLQGLRRLRELGGERVDLARIDVCVD